MKVKLLTEHVRRSARRGGIHLYVPRNPRSHLRGLVTVVKRGQGLTGLRRTETVDPDDATEGDWGMPPGGGCRSTLMISWIEASRASTRDDIWFTG